MVKSLKSLKYAGTCIDCDATLDVGMPARWLGRGKVTCADGEGCREGDAPLNPLSLASNAPQNGSSWSESKVDHIAPIDRPSLTDIGKQVTDAATEFLDSVGKPAEPQLGDMSLAQLLDLISGANSMLVRKVVAGEGF